MSECLATDRLLQSLRVHTPGATEDMIKLELFNVIDEFFRRTSAWQEEVDIGLQKGYVEYGIPMPVNATMVRALGVRHNGIPMAPTGTGTSQIQNAVGRIDPFEIRPDGDTTYDPDASDINPATGTFSWAIYRPGYITVTFAPNDDQIKYPLVAVIALSISRGCLECECDEWSVPEWMWDLYFHDWYDGTLGRLYAMPAKPWSSKELAVFHGKRFRNQMAYRKQEVPRGLTWGTPGPALFPRNGWT